MPATIGIRGEVGGWKTDFSVGRGHNSFDYEVRDTLNTSFGPRARAISTPAASATGRTSSTSICRANMRLGFAKPLSVAVGAEYRQEQFKIRPGDLQSWAIGPLFRASITTTAANCTAQQGVFNDDRRLQLPRPGRRRPARKASRAFPTPARPTTPATAGRPMSNWTPIRSRASHDARRPLRELLRLRHRPGTASSPLRWEPVDGYALRGSISNGFRAPSLHQQFFTTTSTNFIAGVPVDISTVAVNSPVALALGSRAAEAGEVGQLQPRRDRQPAARPHLHRRSSTRSRSRTAIVLTENLGAAGSGTAAQNAAVKAVLDANGFNSVGAARFFINGLDTTTQGVDVVAAYNFRRATSARWTLTAAYNYNKNKIDRRLNALGPLATIPGLVLFGRVEGIRFTNGQPRDKIVFSADGDIGNFGLTARTTRYGKVVSPGAAAPIADPTSLTASVPTTSSSAPSGSPISSFATGRRPAEFAIGANNVFDVYPDRSPFGPRPASIGGVYPANQKYIPYSIFSPFGFNGRFVYGRVSVNF